MDMAAAPHPLRSHRRPPGVGYALAAAVLFGVSTPGAKLLLVGLHPALAAGLLYLGAGLGLTVAYALRRTRTTAGLRWSDAPWLAGAVFTGGVLGPLLLMVGLRVTEASTAALMLNL